MHETLREPVIGRYSTNEQMVLSEHCSLNADSVPLVRIVGSLLRISFWVQMDTFYIHCLDLTGKYAKNKYYLSGFPENLLLTLEVLHKASFIFSF